MLIRAPNLFYHGRIYVISSNVFPIFATTWKHSSRTVYRRQILSVAKISNSILRKRVKVAWTSGSIFQSRVSPTSNRTNKGSGYKVTNSSLSSGNSVSSTYSFFYSDIAVAKRTKLKFRLQSNITICRQETRLHWDILHNSTPICL